MPFISPLRYPGGKRKLSSFVRQLIDRNVADCSTYAEPYAGGAGVALDVLLSTSIAKIVLNDADPSIYAFWATVKNDSERLCRRLAAVPLTMEEWHRQRQVLASANADRLDLAVAVLYLNRTNRSGVLQGGVIGGQSQCGPWKLSARFNKAEIIRRVETIASEQSRLHVSNKDALALLRTPMVNHEVAFVFLDPPYFHKADRRLYRNDYAPGDHAKVAGALKRLAARWLLSYDDCKEIRELYKGFRFRTYAPAYSAGEKRLGRELLVLSTGLRAPRALTQRT